MEQDENLIRIFDKYGRERYITKDEWRGHVLPASLESHWNDADELYGIIVQSLNDGFHADVVKAAEQLYAIDTHPDRGATILGIVYMKNGRLDDAEKVLRTYIAKHGEEGVVLTNLAKVYSARGDDAKAESMLWHALELDPNLDNGMGWYYSIHRERGGDAAGADALRGIARIPGSWRAQIWLARDELQAGHLDAALKLYRESLARVEKPVPADVLEQISGDLGKAGRLRDLLSLCEPHFTPEAHGLRAGNNFIKAHVDLGELDAAKGIVNALFAFKRPDWQDTLNYWDMEIAKKRVAQMPSTPKTPMQVHMLCFEGPVWLRPDSSGADLFPKKTSAGARLCFLGSTAEKSGEAKTFEPQMSDIRGRLSRALPLFLAEQIELNSDAKSQVLIPYLTEKGSEGFVLSGTQWRDQDAVQYARQHSPAAADYVVTTHLRTQSEPWTLELRLIRTSDGQCLETMEASLRPEKPQGAIPQLARDLMILLFEEAGVKTSPPAPLYQVPSGPQFAYYLLRLEQMLAVRCSDLKNGGGPLSGEREIIDGNIQLCLDCPQNVTVRLLLAKTVAAMKHVRPDILPEFQDKLAALQKEHPLPGPSQFVVRKILNEALAA